MPHKDLYSIIDFHSDDDSVIAAIRINASHSIFEGHFPGSPVTPGVIQLEMVKSVMEQLFQKGLKMKALRTCKFLQVLNPTETQVLKIKIKYKQTETLEVTASGEWEEATFFKAQITYI